MSGAVVVKRSGAPCHGRGVPRCESCTRLFLLQLCEGNIKIAFFAKLCWYPKPNSRAHARAMGTYDKYAPVIVKSQSTIYAARPNQRTYNKEYAQRNTPYPINYIDFFDINGLFWSFNWLFWSYNWLFWSFNWLFWSFNWLILIF